jgi:hypothetical protein
MDEQVIEQDELEAVSEQQDVESVDEQDGQKMVPLAAMIATRKKWQDAELRAAKAEAAQQAYQDQMNRASQAPVEEEDPRAIVEKQHLNESNAMTKRDILETVYQENHPEAVQLINKHLKAILEKKPWLAASVDMAQNRYARAHEIVNDYLHLVEEKPVVKTPTQDGRRIIQNAQKPRSPAEFGKSAKPEGAEFLKSIQGKKEFRDYRQKVLRGEA